MEPANLGLPEKKAVKTQVVIVSVEHQDHSYSTVAW